MSLSKRMVSIIFDILIILFSITYFGLSFKIKEGSSLILASSYYPRLIATLLFILGMSSLRADIWGDRKYEKSRIEIGNINRQVIIFLTILVFIVVWQFFKVFYPIVGLSTLILVWIFNNEQSSKEKFIKTSIIACVFTVFVYVVFELALSVEFIQGG